jgi:hypothetical protein
LVALPEPWASYRGKKDRPNSGHVILKRYARLLIFNVPVNRKLRCAVIQFISPSS